MDIDLYSEDLIDRDERGQGHSEDEDDPAEMGEENVGKLSDADDDLNNGGETGSQANQGKVAEPKKKRTVLNPQPKLNGARLKGPRGLVALITGFKNIKYQGPGHEVEDLDNLLKCMEHWAHRMYPRFAFDDCINQLEKLGKKQDVQTHAKRIRLNLLQDDLLELVEDDVVVDSKTDEPMDLFDDLLDRQVEVTQPAPPPITLTSEQIERMNQNRLLAIEKLKARKTAQQEN